MTPLRAPALPGFPPPAAVAAALATRVAGTLWSPDRGSAEGPGAHRPLGEGIGQRGSRWQPLPRPCPSAGGLGPQTPFVGAPGPVVCLRLGHRCLPAASPHPASDQPGEGLTAVAPTTPAPEALSCPRPAWTHAARVRGLLPAPPTFFTGRQGGFQLTQGPLLRRHQVLSPATQPRRGPSCLPPVVLRMAALGTAVVGGGFHTPTSFLCPLPWQPPRAAPPVSPPSVSSFVSGAPSGGRGPCSPSPAEPPGLGHQRPAAGAPPSPLSTAPTSGTVEIDFLLHFCRFTKI